MLTYAVFSPHDVLDLLYMSVELKTEVRDRLCNEVAILAITIKFQRRLRTNDLAMGVGKSLHPRRRGERATPRLIESFPLFSFSMLFKHFEIFETLS